MSRRVPVFATILVAIAVAAMVALGIWQLQRRQEKDALVARLAANRDLPPIAFPQIPIGDDLLFRRAGAFCLQPTAWQSEGGHDATGKPGWRQIAQCRTGAEGAGFAVQIGVAATPNAKATWAGGAVQGYIARAPDHRPLIAGLFDKGVPKTLMLVADPPLGRLAANPAADLSSVPNNHLAYAVQWFLFAGIAATIYALALRRRLARR
jgi:cytochrome oxidase assembly protein ShyY1